MKKLFVLFIAFLVSVLSACNEEAISASSENAQHEESSKAVNESSTVSEESRELTLKEKFPDHNIRSIQNDRCIAVRKGRSDSDRENYIINGDGEIIKAFNCDRIVTISKNKSLLYIVMSDGSAYFINTDGERVDDVLWDSLIPWEKILEGDFLGRRGEEYYVLNSNGETVMQISTEPELYGEYDGLTIVSAFRIDDWYYGVMKDGEFIIEPQFWDMPIIKKGRIVVNSNSVDILSSKGYIYDYSGNLVKTVCGDFKAHEDFDYIIERELKDEFTEEAIYSILDFSGKKLYAAPKGVSIDIVKNNPWETRVERYYVTLNGDITHLNKLIDGIVYPEVTIREYADAMDIDPEKVTLFETPYLYGNIGRRYLITDEVKNSVKKRLLSYLALADIDFNEKKLVYKEYENDFFVKYDNVCVRVDRLSVATGYDNTLQRDPVDPLSDPIVRNLCKMTFSTTENLKTVSDSEGRVFTIYEEKDTVAETMLSITRKRVEVFSDGFTISSVSAIDQSDEAVHQTYTLDAISCNEAITELRKGNYINPPYSLIDIDHENGTVEGVELDYILITECECDECYDIGYYIPCYCFNLRDKDSPEYCGEVYVPAIDINEFNNYLKSISKSRVDHYWTSE